MTTGSKLFNEQLSTPAPSKQFEGIDVGKILKDVFIPLRDGSKHASILLNSVVNALPITIWESPVRIMEREARISEQYADTFSNVAKPEKKAVEKIKREVAPPGEQAVGINEIDSRVFSEEEAINFIKG
jgi:hypothetical protein